jgi:23S rRNA (pseudouridine1915-N3)-methyltransferase
VKIIFLVFGTTKDDYIKEGIKIYLKRITGHIPFEITEIPEPKGYEKFDSGKKREEEARLFSSKIQDSDEVVLLDEHGTELSSVDFSVKLQSLLNKGKKRLVFVVGGAYGFSESLYSKYNQKISLSKMTFTHQMVRLVFVEQVYRAFSILKGLPYHHEG